MTVDSGIAESAVLAALAAAGVPVIQPPDRSADLLLDIGGTQLAVQLKIASTVTPQSLPKQLTRPRSNSAVSLLVADRVVAAARDILKRNGWSWLDLRGHLHLAGPGVLVDTPVPAWEQARAAPIELFSGKVMLEVACSLLITPNDPRPVRQLAREPRHSPSSVSVSLRALHDAGLVDDRGTPVVPDLFWEMAPAWRFEAVDVARIDLVADPPSPPRSERAGGSPRPPPGGH